MSVETPQAPPSAIEAEQSVLGALLLQPEALDRIEWLQPEHFYRDGHRKIFAAARKLIEGNRGCDVVLLSEALGADLMPSGGIGYIASLAQNTPSAYNIGRYAEIVRDKFILRTLAAHGSDICAKALDPTSKPMELAEQAESAFLSVLEPQAGEAMSMLDAANEALEWMDNPQHGISTGLLNLDGVVGGVRPEELIIIAGRPGMGKSSLAQCIAEKAARSEPTLLCSLEMSARQIASRSLAYHAKNMGSMAEATRHIAGLKLHIDPRSPLSIPSLRLRARRHKRRHGLSLLIVDYLQLMTGPKSDNRNQEIGAISRGLKSLAKELKIPVIAVASLNRGVESRIDKRPIMSDLKESGDIEADADLVIMVYRDSEYNPNSEWGSTAEIIVRKHREGKTGTAYLRWDGEHTRFHDHIGSVPRHERKERAGKVANFTDYKSRAAGDGVDF